MYTFNGYCKTVIRYAAKAEPCGDGFCFGPVRSISKDNVHSSRHFSTSGMGLDFLKGFIAQIMFYLAGVRRRRLRGNAQLNKNLCQQLMPLIDMLGNFLTGRQKRDIPIIVHLNIAVLPQVPHCYADAGLGKAQFMDNINGTHHSVIFQEF